ncbi:MAG: hypothetical protein NT171_20365 [Planctomycetota bacterium]|nr:hypothetical protein [Planctomycetota bacterium]
MKHRIHLAACLSALALAGVSAVPASANPGLLHKHGARPVGVPALLPGQFPAGGVAATTAGASAPNTAPSSTAVAGVAPGSNGCVVVTGNAGATVVLVPDGLPVGGPLVDGVPGIDPGMVDSGMLMADGFPAGSCGGGIDVGSADGAGDMPMVLDTTFLPVGPGGDGAGPCFVNQTMSASMTSAASASTSDVVGGSGRALAGGLPNRAAGVRTDALATVRHHGHRPMRVGGSTAEGVAVSGDDSSGSVVQAGGVAQEAAGTVPHARQAKLAASNVAGQAVIPPAATAAPRWRDRLRFAWPTTK